MRRSCWSLALCVALLTGGLQAQSTRDVSVSARSVVRVHAKMRFTTMIVLPEHEEILDFVCGDKDFWVISGAQNLAYIKPAKAGATTNLNLITAAGRIYSFVLAEGAADPDLKLYVSPDDSFAAPAAPPRFYAASQVEELRQAVRDAQQEAEAARLAASQSMEAAQAAADQAAADVERQVGVFRAAYPGTLQFPYRFRANVKPFFVSAIFHDGAFTYIRTAGNELPALYEVRDRVPNLVNFQVQDGLYIVPKVLDAGYLVIGTQQLVFDQAR